MGGGGGGVTNFIYRSDGLRQAFGTRVSKKIHQWCVMSHCSEPVQVLGGVLQVNQSKFTKATKRHCHDNIDCRDTLHMLIVIRVL